MATTGAETDLKIPASARRQALTPAPADSPLVGRSRELARLEATLELVEGGRAMAVLIGGDAGVGKSRVVEEFCDRARLRGDLVATGLCMPADNAVPYAPVVGVLRDIGRHLGHPPKAARLLEAMGGYIDVGDESPARLETADRATVALAAGQFAKTVLFESVLQETARLAERSAVVLVVEDLHWADSASSELVDFLIRNLGDARVLVAATYRDDELDAGHPLTPWLRELRRHPRVQEVLLGPLDREALAALIAHEHGDRPHPAFLDSIWSRSLGNPFFAEQLLAEGDPDGLPDAVKAVIDHRVRQLPEPVQRLLELAAAAGGSVQHDLLRVTANLTDDALEASLATAIDKKIIAVDESGTGYRFRHALLREAVYDRLLAAQRRRLHHSIASALTDNPELTASAPGSEVAELASHWWAAGAWAQALPASLQAAEAAVAGLAFPEAITYLERALVADSRLPEAAHAAGVSRAALLEKAADIAYLAGENARAVDLAQQAADAIDARRDPVVAARCQTLLGRNLWAVGDSAAAFEAWQAGLRLLPDGASIERAQLLAEQARAHLLLSQYAAGEELARQALQTARAFGARHVEGHALNSLGACRFELRGYEDGMPLIRQSLEIAEELALPEDLNRAYANLSHSMLEAGRLEEVASMMFDCAAVGEDLWGCRLNGATGNGVEAMVRLGRYAEAERLLALLGNQALGVCAPAPWLLPSPMLLRRGEFQAAEDAIAYAIDMTSRLGDVQHAATAQALAGELALERGRPDEAAVALERAHALSTRSEDETLLPELCMWSARAIADQHQRADAAERVAEGASRRARADELLATVTHVIDSREHRGATATARQLAAAAQTASERSRLGRSDAELWARAAQLWAQAHEAYPEAYCRWREAEAVMEGRGARAQALAALEAAHAIAQRLEARPLLDRISQLAQRGRLELRAADVCEPSPAAQAAEALGLTPREVEVLGLLADGRSDRDIASALFISRKTVSVHVSNVLRKLAVSRRFEAARIGQAHGLGTATPSIQTLATPGE